MKNQRENDQQIQFDNNYLHKSKMRLKFMKIKKDKKILTTLFI